MNNPIIELNLMEFCEAAALADLGISAEELAAAQGAVRVWRDVMVRAGREAQDESDPIGNRQSAAGNTRTPRALARAGTG